MTSPNTATSGPGSFDGVITPEAVLLQFQPAGVGSRTLAATVDIAIRVAVFLIALFLVFILLDLASGPTWVATTLLILLGFGLIVLYPIVLEAAWNGRTLGKALVGIRVVTDTGAPIGLRQATIRAAVGLFEGFGTSGFVALASIFFNSRSKRLGDMAAGTLVLRQRHAESVPRATQFDAPAGSEDFVATLDVSGLSTSEYQTVRSFLMRANTLNRDARNSLAEQLGYQLAGRLGVDPPSSLTAQEFLMAVAAAYQRRPRL